MILDYSQLSAQGPWGYGTFQGQVIASPSAFWQSALPPNLAGWIDAIATNPAAGFGGAVPMPAAEGLYNNPTAQAFNAAWADMSNRGLINVVTASRNLVGTMVKSVGFLSGSFNTLGGIFREESSTALRLINVAQMIVESEYFGKAIDAIGWIPVVGWIIKAVVEVANIVADIVRAVREQRWEDAYKSIARRLSVPIEGAAFSSEGDQQVTQRVFGMLEIGNQFYNPQALIRPAFNGNLDDFSAQGVADPDTSKLAVGWTVSPGALTGGMGFVPGTGNISQTMFFPASNSGGGCGAGAVRDLGSLYPTPQGLVNAWWSMLLEQGPAMYSVAPLQETSAWETYIESMLAFGKSTMDGWTCGETSQPPNFSDGQHSSKKFDCVPEVHGTGECGSAGKKSGTRTYPSDFGRDHHTVFMAYLYRLFFGPTGGVSGSSYSGFTSYKKNWQDTLPLLGPLAMGGSYDNDLGFPWPEPGNLDVSQAVPVAALENLYERQVATLQSVHCMYVNGEDPERFPAFNKSAPGGQALKAKWEQAATALLQSNDWKRVTYQDMPEGTLKAAFAQKAAGAGLDPNEINPPCPPLAPGEDEWAGRCPPRFGLASGPTVLGDPVPPAPPEPNDVDQQKFAVGKILDGGGNGGGKGGGAGIAIAAAAAAFMFLKK